MAEESETWSNGPGYTYPPHAHDYRKTLVCMKGSLRVTLHMKNGERFVQLEVGDFVDIPARTMHSMVVGPQGVTCSETHHRDLKSRRPAL